jgi:hypothetical protein
MLHPDTSLETESTASMYGLNEIRRPQTPSATQRIREGARLCKTMRCKAKTRGFVHLQTLSRDRVRVSASYTDGPATGGVSARTMFEARFLTMVRRDKTTQTDASTSVRA